MLPGTTRHFSRQSRRGSPKHTKQWDGEKQWGEPHQLSWYDDRETSRAQICHWIQSKNPGSRTPSSRTPKMESQDGTLNFQQDQDLSPIRNKRQGASQRKYTIIRRIYLRSNEQYPIAKQGKTGKKHPNGNRTRTMRLGVPTGVAASRVPIPNQGQNEQAEIQICNSLCLPLKPYQVCTSTKKPKTRRDIKVKASFWGIQ